MIYDYCDLLCFAENYHGSNTGFLVAVLVSVVSGVFIAFALVALCYRSSVIHKNIALCLRLVFSPNIQLKKKLHIKKIFTHHSHNEEKKKIISIRENLVKKCHSRIIRENKSDNNPKKYHHQHHQCSTLIKLLISFFLYAVIFAHNLESSLIYMKDTRGKTVLHATHTTN